jgi:hypothetical protein
MRQIMLLVTLAAAVTVLVIWFQNPPGWVGVLQMIVMVTATVLLALVMGSLVGH